MFKAITENLKNLGYAVSVFESKEDALKYLISSVKGKTIGFGGSVTIAEMGLIPALSESNTVYSHSLARDAKSSLEIRKSAASSDIYFSSVNGIAETGEIINIDGNCNRVSSTLYGHEKVYFIVGKNKLANDFDSALYRARNIAAPKNAQRLNRKTPCAVKADKCYNCNSPERICRALTVLWTKPTSGEYEVVFINENLGY